MGVGLALTLGGLGSAGAQPQATAVSPVYLDDSPRATEALVRARELAALGNESDAARVLQGVLDQDGARLAPAVRDPDLFIEVREIIHDLLLSEPELLARYRELSSEPARRALEDEGDPEGAAARYLLTPAGFDASLRLAERAYEHARFDAAYRALVLLERHPDRAGERARGASRLMSRCAAAIRAVRGAEDPSWVEAVASRAREWAVASGLDPAPGVLRAPEDLPPVRTPFSAAESTALEDLLPRPLWSDLLGDPLPVRVAAARGEASRSPLPVGARWLGAAATAQGDTVFVSDGQTVSAWNRFTLTLRWRLKLDGAVGGPYALRADQSPAEMTTVAAGEGRLAVVTGLRLEQQVREVRHLVVIDAASGRPLWTRGPFDTGVEGAAESLFVGPPLISEGTVVLRVEKDATSRRLDGLYLVGFDLETGALRWTRPVGSSGALTFGYRPPTLDGMSSARGLVFTLSRVGVMTAVEVASGRTRWARRDAPPLSIRAGESEPWEFNVPQVRDGRVLMLSPARDRVLMLDAETGAVLGSRPSSALGNPAYLLLAGDDLVGVGRSALHSLALASLTDAAQEPVEIARFAPEIFRGRVIPAPGRVLAPLFNEVVVVNTPAALAGEGRIASRVRLDQPGVVLPLDGQLVVVDESRIHSYLIWSVAERQLRQRMESAPADPAPAITYAELAFRSGRTEGLVQAIDHALRAIESDPLAETVPEDLSRVFRSVLTMIEPGSAGSPLDAATRGALVDRLGRSASTGAERASFHLTAGAVYEGAGDLTRAVQSYQAVLDAPDLAGAVYASGGTEVPADFAATRRLRALIEAHGPALYQPYEADAQRLLSEARAALDADAFEAIARRYPVSRTAVTAWMESASHAQSQGRTPLAALALEEGLAAARLSLDKGDPLIGELGGRLVSLQKRAGQFHAVLDTLTRLERDHPGLALTDMGGPIDADALVRSVSESIAQTTRRPRVGPRPTATATIVGWTVEEPLAEESPLPVTDAIVLRSEEGELALWRLAPGAPAGLARVWGSVTKETLLWLDQHGAYFAEQIGEGPWADHRVLCRAMNDGQVRWATAPFRTVVPPGEPERILAQGGPNAPARFLWTPLEPNASVADPMLAVDGSTMVLIDRLGRAAAYELSTGRLLWTRGDLMPRVHDAALAGGTLLVGGSRLRVDLSAPGPDPLQAEPNPGGLILAIDARSGQTVYRWESDDAIRWVRLTPEGHAVAGLDPGVVSIDLVRQRLRWRSESPKLKGSLAAWAVPGRVIVRSEAPELWQVTTDDGAVARRALDLRGRLNEGFDEVTVRAIGSSVGIATGRGLALIAPDASLAGLDARPNDSAPILHAGFGADFVPVLERSPLGEGAESGSYSLTIFDLESLRTVSTTTVRFGQAPAPVQMALIDGKVLINAGAAVTVIDAPPEAPP
ncbi:MAG TPA: hypothetical protein DEB06_00025, partial [Phycisphaerales bacterium]|nr:hypothetical protein [Phycisphaerales bacterium]